MKGHLLLRSSEKGREVTIAKIADHCRDSILGKGEYCPGLSWPCVSRLVLVE